MPDFRVILDEVEPGMAHNPYAAKTFEGQWLAGFVSVEFLQANFGQYGTAAEMKAATTSEGLRLFFDWLAEQGKIPA